MENSESFGDGRGRPLPIEILELDIDTRLVYLWHEVNLTENWDEETAATFIRQAYARGYEDALKEPVRGQLFKEHGYRIPSRPAVFPDFQPDSEIEP